MNGYVCKESSKRPILLITLQSDIASADVILHDSQCDHRSHPAPNPMQHHPGLQIINMNQCRRISVTNKISSNYNSLFYHDFIIHIYNIYDVALYMYNSSLTPTILPIILQSAFGEHQQIRKSGRGKAIPGA